MLIIMNIIIILLYYTIVINFVDSASHLQNPCPLWHHHSITQGGCKCCNSYGSNFVSIGKCSKDYLYINYSYCVTYNPLTNDVAVTKCLWASQKILKDPLRHCFKLKISTNITGSKLNDVTCNVYNRKGAQCRYCIDGHGPAVFSDGITCADCSEHRHLWVLNLLFQLTMVTILYIIIVVFQINGASSPLHIFITYTQLVVYAIMVGARFYSKIICQLSNKLAVPILTFLGIFNLDFFRFVIPPLCVSTTLKSLHVLLFDYIIAVFPIVLTVLIYVAIELHDRNCFIIVFLSSPLRKFWYRNWNPKETIVTTFATFILLSYSKFLFVSSSLLQFINIYHCRNREIITNQTVLFHDPTIRFLHSEHIPYVVLALLVMVVFVVLPPFLLLFYPTRLFRKCLSCCGFQRWDILHLIMDIFQGWYKDGTEGTYDYRYVSALYMVLRFLFACCVSIFLVSNRFSDTASHLYIIAGLLHVFLGVVFLTLKPYKLKWMNTTDGILLLLIGVMGLTYGLNNRIIEYFSIASALLVFVYISSFIIFKCVKKLCVV